MVWVQIIPTRETGKLESAISTWTPSALSSMHRSNYKPLVLFDVLPFNHLSIPSIPLIICSPKYVTIFDPGWNVHLRISTIRTFHHSLVDFLGSDNALTAKPPMEILAEEFAAMTLCISEFDRYCQYNSCHSATHLFPVLLSR